MRIWALTIAIMSMVFLGCGSDSGGGTKKTGDGTTGGTATTGTATAGTTGETTGDMTTGETTGDMTTGGTTGDMTTGGTTGETTGDMTTGGTTEGGTGGLPTTTGGTTEGGTTGDATTGGGTGGTGAGDCASLPSDQCLDCMAQQNPAGAQAFMGGIQTHCFCANECQTQCAAVCSNPAAQDQACTTCVQDILGNQSSGCFTGFAGGCQANADCMAFLQSMQECQ